MAGFAVSYIIAGSAGDASPAAGISGWSARTASIDTDRRSDVWSGSFRTVDGTLGCGRRVATRCSISRLLL